MRKRKAAPYQLGFEVSRRWLALELGLGVFLNINIAQNIVRQGHSMTRRDQDKNKTILLSHVNTEDKT